MENPRLQKGPNQMTTERMIRRMDIATQGDLLEYLRQQEERHKAQPVYADEFCTACHYNRKKLRTNLATHGNNPADLMWMADEVATCRECAAFLMGLLEGKL